MGANPRMRHLAVSAAALAAVFNTVVPAPALAAGGRGLIDNDAAVNKYRPALSIALRKAGKDDDWGLTTGSFALSMEAKLKAPLPRPQLV